VAACCSSASFSSRVSRASSASWIGADKDAVLGASLRFGFAVSRRRVFVRPLLTFERLFVGFAFGSESYPSRSEEHSGSVVFLEGAHGQHLLTIWPFRDFFAFLISGLFSCHVAKPTRSHKKWGKPKWHSVKQRQPI